MHSKEQLRKFEKILKEVEIKKPLITTYSNVTAYPYKNSNEIKQLLVKQIYSPVKWEQILHTLYGRPKNCPEGFPDTYECGPGQQLGTILKQVNAQAFKNYKNIAV